MVSDLTERLRDYGSRTECELHEDRIEAADEIERRTAALAEAREKALEEAAKVAVREMSECIEAVNAIDVVDFPTETQQWNRHFYRGGYRASTDIIAAIRALKEKP